MIVRRVFLIIGLCVTTAAAARLPAGAESRDAFVIEDPQTIQADGRPPSVSSRATARVKDAGRMLLVGLIVIVTLIGFQYMTRGTSVRHVRGVGADGSPVSPDEPQFPLSVAMLTGASILPGNRVEVMLNGDGTYARLWQDLRSATDSITLQMYYGQPGQLADTLAQILLERAAAGVRVYVLYDAFGAQKKLSPGMRATFRDAGISVVAFRPFSFSALHLLQHRSHVRGIVIDGRTGWTGGFGIDDKWLGDGRTHGAWRETNVRFEGPAVRQLQAAFTAAWAEATGVLFSGRTTLPDGSTGTTRAGLLYAAPTAGSTTAERFLALSIAGARKSLYIANCYFAPDRNFVGLIAAAARRGVDVRVLTAGSRTDVQSVRMAGRAHYEALLTAGARIYEWLPSTLHTKTFVVDGVWATIGSLNFDNRSLSINDEATLMVLDDELGRQMNDIFAEDLTCAEEITLEQFRRRPWSHRVAEQAADLIAPVL